MSIESLCSYRLTSLSPGKAWLVSSSASALVPKSTRDNHALRLQIIIQRLRPVLATEAACLHAAKRQFIVTVVQRVHPHVSCLNPIDRGFNVVEILRPYRRPKPVDRIVRALNRFIDTVHTEDRQRRTECLLLHR